MATGAEPAKKVWTADDLLALPDDGVERWVISGELREKPSEFPEAGMTVRNRHHCDIMGLIVTALNVWLRTRQVPRGKAYCGDLGVILPGRDGTVGVDVVYAPPEVVAVQNDDETTLLAGVPTLTVEILSPNDTVEQIEEKTDAYLAAGVPLAWVVDPTDRTVTVYRPGAEPELFNVTHTIPAHPAMPGFSPAVAELFE